MNIIYLHCHDLGRYLSCYGYPADTPHLQSFADEAVTFRQAHCAAPTCSPSRAALLTGESAHQSGMLGLAHRGFRLKHPQRLLTRFLREQHGFQSYLAGIQHVFDFHAPELEASYDRILAPHNPGKAMNDPIRDIEVAKATAAFLRGHGPEQGPLFLECGFFFPHRSFPETDIDLAAKSEQLQGPEKLPDVPAIREDTAAFLSAVRNMDQAFGIVWDALKEGGWTENSLIFFTTDHGIPFPHYKCNLQDSGTGVALMIRPPGKNAAAQTTDALVSHLDLYPTLCDYLGLAAPSWLQGHSLRPLIEGHAPHPRKELFAEVSYHAGYEPKRCIRTERYSYIRNYELEHHPAMANVDGGATKSWMLNEDLLSEAVPSEQLYDTWKDPQEQHNRIDDPTYAKVAAALRQGLNQWMQDTQDPLLAGTVPLPPGAKVSPRGSIHP